MINIQDNTTIHIPTNYTDAGKIFGFFEIRNIIEAAVITLPIIFLIFTLSPLSLTWTIILGAVIVVPVCGFSLMGILDFSLFTFLRIYLKWRKARRILHYGERSSIPCQK